ncbi:Amino acid transporter AVT6E [Vitis vinifera]|uniref:Amino acid transporter AVT6E n=1 Tax=Vitis vinifera TaxID=29760 RepID=A0A438H9F3_VITVI|nr:Amino acid transporter AVT6E [Vitis vinifera]
MESNYSALRTNSFVELQIHNDKNEDGVSLVSQNPRSSEKPHVKLLPLDESNNVNDVDDDFDFDIDNYPLMDGGVRSNKGSGISGAVFNLTTSIIGAGIMALPATMKILGVVLGFVLIVLMGILSEISVELLLRFSVLNKASSYGEVVQCALGRSARILSEICIIVNNAGVLVVYLIIIGDVLSGSAHHVGIDSLSLTSAASVALAVVFVFVACVVAFIKLVEGQIESPRMAPDFGSKAAILDLLVVIPIMTNAYVCHFNVQPIYNELEGPSPQKMNRVGRITTVLCIVVYALTAISGYLLFGKDTESDVLTNFDKNLGIRFSSALNYIVRVGYVLHLVLVFPVVHFSLRQTVDALMFEASAPLSESRKRSLALTVVLLMLIYFGSTMIPNIWTAFKFTGATTAVSLGFIFPALIALKLGGKGVGLSLGEKFLSWLMLILATIVSVVGVIGNIYSLKSKSE